MIWPVAGAGHRPGHGGGAVLAVRGSKPGPSGWRVLLAVLIAVPGLLVLGAGVWLVWGVVTWDGGGRGPEQAPCEEALAFGGARLPQGAYDTDCSVQSFLDTMYEGSFRMPREGARDWLADMAPQGSAPVEGCWSGADLCLDMDQDEGGLPPGAEAHHVSVDVFYENATTALVRWSAFTM